MGKMLEDGKNVQSLAFITFERGIILTNGFFPVKDEYLLVLQLKFHTFWIIIKVNLLHLKIGYF